MLVIQKSVVGAREEEGLQPADLLDEMRAQFLINGVRLPFSWASQLRVYGKRIRDPTTCLGYISWSDDNLSVSYKGVRHLGMDALRDFVREQVGKAQVQLERLLLIHPEETREDLDIQFWIHRVVADIGDLTEGSLNLNHTITNMTADPTDALLPWVPITATKRNKDRYYLAFTRPQTIEVDFNTTRFPISVSQLMQTSANAAATNWTVVDQPDVPPIHVAEIVSVMLDNGSKVQLVLPFVVVVLVSNAVKVIVMWTLYKQSHTVGLATIGDAVQSFLQMPDRSTIGLCLESKETMVDKVETEHLRRTARVAVCYQRCRVTSSGRMRDPKAAPLHTVVQYKVEAPKHSFNKNIDLEPTKAKAMPPTKWQDTTRNLFGPLVAGYDSKIGKKWAQVYLL